MAHWRNTMEKVKKLELLPAPVKAKAGKIEEVKPSSLREQLGIFSNKVANFGGEQQRKNPTKKIRNKRKNADHSRNKSRN